MYIELFLLDNALMDLLILRLAAAMRGTRLYKGRAALGCFTGALYALWAACWPPAGCLAAKVAFGLLLAMALSPRGWRDYGLGVLCLFTAAFLVGGLAFALAMATGGRIENGAVWGGIPLRTALVTALAASFLPRAIRRILRRKKLGMVTLTMLQDGKRRILAGMVDSGNGLYEPCTGLPVIVAYLPDLAGQAQVPIPVATVHGETGFIWVSPPAAPGERDGPGSLDRFEPHAPAGCGRVDPAGGIAHYNRRMSLWITAFFYDLLLRLYCPGGYIWRLVLHP